MSEVPITDPLARTVLSWQRTLLVLAGLAVLLAVGLSRSGHAGLGLLVLASVLAPLPAVVMRERELIAGHTVPTRSSAAVLMTLATVGLAVAGLILLWLA